MERMVTEPGWERVLAAQRLHSVGAFYRLRDGVLFTRSGSTEVRRCQFLKDGQPHAVFLKKYWANNWRQLWSGFWRGTFFGRSKVRREFENLRWLRAHGLDAPEPIAYGEERRGRWLIRSFLLSAAVPDALPLDAFVRDHLPRLSPPAAQLARRELLDRLADYVRRLHAAHFVHHDLFWRNILLSGAQLDHFYLIDAHKGRRWRPWAETASRAKDLATLDAPAPWFFRRSERLRFLLRYRQHARLPAADKPFIRRVLRIAAPLRERQRRRVVDASRPDHAERVSAADEFP
jgi:tRNA A-37 threonylcarbamoyl transferase component Bud32